MRQLLTSEAYSTCAEQAVVEQFRQVAKGERSGTVWFHQPQNLYLSDAQAETYLEMMRAPGYGGTFHRTLQHLICENRKEILAGLREPVDLVDLGPGYPDKTLPLLECLRSAARPGRYIPVDISRRFLRLVGDVCRPYGLPVEPQNCLFEELPSKLRHGALDGAGNRLVILGVTFMNYPPRAILRLIARMLRPGDAALLAMEAYRAERQEEILSPYRSQTAERFNFLALMPLGVPAETLNYFVRFQRNRIEMGFEFLESIRLAGIEVPAGREVVTSVSCRHTPEAFRGLLEEQFEKVRVFESADRGCAVAKIS